MTILSKKGYCIFKIHKPPIKFSVKSSYEKDLKSINTRSNLQICILILIEPCEVSNGTWKLK